MVSRTKAKIDSKLADIKAIYPQVETIGIVCDFSKLSTMAQYRDLVATTELKDIDIGILCMNAGCFSVGPLDFVDDERYEGVWNVNGLQNAYLLKALVQKLLNRDKRTAVLITSSMANEMVMPGAQSYSATKAMTSNFG